MKTDRLRDYCSLFTSGVVGKVLKGDRSLIDCKIDRYDGHWRERKQVTYLQYLQYAYGVIESEYRNEYVYKNNFLNQFLIKELGQDSSRIFSEFKVGDSIADLVMFNGVSKAFEIKSELDSAQRLPGQLTQYAKIFNEVYLIIPQKKADEYSGYPQAGLITYSAENRCFTIKQKAPRNSEVCVETIMQVLRSDEYKCVVREYYGQLPAMTSFTQFNECHALIREIPSEVLNTLFIRTMKRRKQSNVFSARYHSEFNQVMLAMKMTESQKHSLLLNLNHPISNLRCTTHS